MLLQKISQDRFVLCIGHIGELNVILQESPPSYFHFFDGETNHCKFSQKMEYRFEFVLTEWEYSRGFHL